MASFHTESSSPTLSVRDLLPPRLQEEWVVEQNGPLDQVIAANDLSTKQIFWRCWAAPTHIWQATIYERQHRPDCPYCTIDTLSLPPPPGSLAALHPDLTPYWHPTANAPLTPRDLTPYSTLLIRWTCPNNPAHSWHESVTEYVQHALESHHCPVCALGWTTDTLRLFLETLQPHLNELNSSELFLIAQQAGLLEMQGDAATIVQGVIDQSIRAHDLAKFIHNGESARHLAQRAKNGGLSRNDDGLPELHTDDLLAAYQNPLLPIRDDRAISYLIESAVQKLWRLAFENPDHTLASLHTSPDTHYASKIKERFLEEYSAATTLPIPSNYNFQIDGIPTPPSLLQRLLAVRLRDRRRFGIFTGTGSGKTIAACLGSRVIQARLTLILTPFNVVPMWAAVIKNAFPDVEICTGTFTPTWKHPERPRYLLLHYELLQLPHSETQIRKCLADNPDLDCCVIDEQHLSKVRNPKLLSLRRQRLNLLTTLASQQNPHLALTAMSATPILNELEEAKSTLELIRGEPLPHLDTTASIPNAMRIHQEITLSGFRWLPRYDIQYREHLIEIDCTNDLARLQALPRSAGILQLEQQLFHIRLPALLRLLQPKTMIYTNLLEGILEPLAHAIRTAGWRVGFFTGEHKDGADDFLNDNIDILIVSDVAAVGYDGFQRVCHRLICLNTPWTHAMFSQLLGRLYRPGQPHHTVDLFLLIARATVEDRIWSWDEGKRTRIRFKRSLADATIDGVIPSAPLQSPQQTYKHLMNWLSRLDDPHKPHLLPTAGP